MSILSVFLQRKEGCAVEDCTALGFCFSCSFLRSGSLFILFAGPPPCTRRPLLKKGSIRKLFCGWQHIFHGRAKNPERRNRCFSETGLWIPVAVPSVGVLCSRAWWEASFRKPLVFRGCLPPARPEKAKPFQAGRSPCTKHRQTVRLCLYAPKKFLRVPRGGFSKTLLGREWDSVPQREGEPVSEVRLFRRDKGLSRNAHRSSGFAFTPKKSF